MKKRIIGLAFSDTHLNIWNKFNQDNKRTLIHFKVLFHIAKRSKELKVPVLFTGDLLHKPDTIDSELLSISLKKLYKLKGLIHSWYGISGNHDLKHSNNFDKRSVSWLDSLSEPQSPLQKIDFKSVELKDMKLHGIPYIDNNRGMDALLSDIIKDKLSKKLPNILMIHTDLPGAKDTDGSEVGSSVNINMNLLAKFDLVLCGHIHKPQRLSKKVYMVGATHQQRRTDRDCELGYWEIYNDLSMKFVAIDFTPKFIDVESDEDIKDDGNYYTVIPKKLEVKEVVDNKLSLKLSKTKLAKKYMREMGVKDKNKKSLLIKVLEETDND